MRDTATSPLASPRGAAVVDTVEVAAETAAESSSVVAAAALAHEAAALHAERAALATERAGVAAERAAAERDLQLLQQSVAVEREEMAAERRLLVAEQAECRALHRSLAERAASDNVVALAAGDAGAPAWLWSAAADLPASLGSTDDGGSGGKPTSSLQLLALGLGQVARMQQRLQVDLDSRMAAVEAARVAAAATPTTSAAALPAPPTPPADGVTPARRSAPGTPAPAPAWTLLDTPMPTVSQLRSPPRRSTTSVSWGDGVGGVAVPHAAAAASAPPPPPSPSPPRVAATQTDTPPPPPVVAYSPPPPPSPPASPVVTTVPVGSVAGSGSDGGVDVSIVAALSSKLRSVQGDLRTTESALKTEVETAALLRSEADALRHALAHVTSQAQVFARTLDGLKEAGLWDPRTGAVSASPMPLAAAATPPPALPPHAGTPSGPPSRAPSGGRPAAHRAPTPASAAAAPTSSRRGSNATSVSNAAAAAAASTGAPVLHLTAAMVPSGGATMVSSSSAVRTGWRGGVAPPATSGGGGGGESMSASLATPAHVPLPHPPRHADSALLSRIMGEGASGTAAMAPSATPAASSGGGGGGGGTLRHISLTLSPPPALR